MSKIRAIGPMFSQTDDATDLTHEALKTLESVVSHTGDASKLGGSKMVDCHVGFTLKPSQNGPVWTQPHSFSGPLRNLFAK